MAITHNIFIFVAAFMVAILTNLDRLALAFICVAAPFTVIRFGPLHSVPILLAMLVSAVCVIGGGLWSRMDKK